MESLLSGEDFEIISDALQETSGLVERMVQIKRNSGFTAGGLNGVAKTPTYLYFDIMGTAEATKQEEAVHTGGIIALGDVTFTTTLDIMAKGEGGDGYTLQEGDILVYDLKEYYPVGIPWREFVAGGNAFTKSIWRRT